MNILKEFQKQWNNYKYRFSPWIAFNLSKRAVQYENQIKINHTTANLATEELIQQLSELLSRFIIPNYLTSFKNSPARREEFRQIYAKNQDILYCMFGFNLAVADSRTKSAGRGVFVAKGQIQRGQIVALYPGTIYFPHQPIL